MNRCERRRWSWNKMKKLWVARMSCITQTSESMSIIYRLTYRLNEETTRQRNEFNALPKNWIDVQPVESIEIISWQILTSVCVIAYAQNMWIAFRRRRVARPNWEKLISERLHIVALINCHFYWNFGVHSWTCFSLSEVSMEHAARGKARPGTQMASTFAKRTKVKPNLALNDT